jgi:flavin-dependent dehydrogenase
VSTRTDVDVAVVGGGLAGSLVARQLHRRLPGLRIAVFERSGLASYKVGESTVEIAGHYLVRRQALAGYLYDRHLPKNGIRYFFDGPERDVPLAEMSEIGTVNLPFHPTFQIDRARMETDLVEMNRSDGIDVRLGVEVADVELGANGAPHVVAIEGPGGRQRASARWLVDASGRVGLLARALGIREPEPTHHVGSVWARYERVADVDAVADDAFRARVRYTTRGISTLHFLHPGYWIWMIRLRGGLTSIGVVGAPARDRAVRTKEGFHAFLLRHRAVRDLLVDAKPVDCGSLGRIAFGTRRFLHPDRWAVIGESATAADPLYSPGSDFIALESDYLTDLVAREAAGEADAEVGRRLELYDRFLRFRHEATIRLYRGLYGTLGSFELMRVKWDFDIGSYHNLWVAPYMCDLYTDEAFLRQQLRQERFVLAALDNFAGLFRRVEASLRERDAYHRANRGRFSHGLEQIRFLEDVGLPRSRRAMLEQAAATFNQVRRDALMLAGEAPSEEPWPLSAFVTRPLVG